MCRWNSPVIICTSRLQRHHLVCLGQWSSLMVQDVIRQVCGHYSINEGFAFDKVITKDKFMDRVQDLSQD